MKRILLILVILFSSCKTTINIRNLQNYKTAIDTSKELTTDQKYELLKLQIDLYFKKR